MPPCCLDLVLNGVRWMLRARIPAEWQGLLGGQAGVILIDCRSWPCSRLQEPLIAKTSRFKQFD